MSKEEKIAANIARARRNRSRRSEEQKDPETDAGGRTWNYAPCGDQDQFSLWSGCEVTRRQLKTKFD